MESTHKEALELAREILRNIELQEYPLSSIVLRCRRLARLVNDEEAYEWFGFEVGGYPIGEDGLVTAKAFAIGRTRGRDVGSNAKGPLINGISIVALEAQVAAESIRLQQEREPDVHHVPANQWDILKPSSGALIRGQIVANITSARERIGKVQGHVHKWVESIAYELGFSETALNIWDRRRQLVDARLSEVAPEAFRRLKALYDRVDEEDPEAWSQAAQTVRNVMKAMADWLNPVQGGGTAEGPAGETIEATDEKYK